MQSTFLSFFKPKHRHNRSLAAWILLAFVLISNSLTSINMVAPCFAAADTEEREFWPSSRVDTNLTREAAEQNLELPTEVELLAQPQPPIKAKALTIAEILGDLIAPSIWLAEQVLGLIRTMIEWIIQPLAEFVVNTIFRAMYNPNIAADQPKQLADFVKPVANMLKDMAIDLLLLLFILNIWKHWTDAAWKGGGNVMASIGRLIATLALIMAWSTISDFIIHISNDMLAQMMFGPEDQAIIQNAQQKITTYLAAGLLGGAIAGQFGSFLLFAVLSILFYETIYVLVLKSIQTALIVAQYMFAPIFLVFFATPDTENIAAGFVRSCVEVSLWTFFWMGFVRILLYALAVDLGFWGNVFMIIGTLQLMMSVPHFIAKAQISPISEFLSGAVIFKSAFAAARNWGPYMPWTSGGGLLGKGFSALGGYFKRDPGGDSSDPGASGLPGSPPGSGPGFAGGGGGGPGGSGPPGRNTNPFNRTSATGGNAGRMDPRDAVAGANREGAGQLGQNDGASGGVNFDGRNGELAGVTHGAADTPAQRAFRNAKASLARAMLRDPASRAALADALGWSPDPKDPNSVKSHNRALGQLAFDAAGAYMNGETGSWGSSLRAATGVMRNAFGDMDTARRDDLLASMQDSDRLDSPFNPNYRSTGEALDRAGLPRNAATMAFANSPLGSRLKGQALANAFRDWEQSMQPALAAAGHTPGSPNYNQALADSLRNTTTDRGAALAAVSSSFAGAPAAERPQNGEEMEAWVTATQNLANSQGIRPEAAVARLRSMMGTTSARNDTRPVPDKLATAGQALNAAAEQRAPAQALAGDTAFANGLYDLAQAHTAASPTLTPQRVYSLLKAAQVAGFNNPMAPGDDALVEQMLEPGSGDWKAGEINPYTMGLARRAQTAGVGLNRDACMRVVNAGTAPGLDPVSFAVAQRVEFDGMRETQAGNAVAALTTECVNLASRHAATGTSALTVNQTAARLATGDTSGLTAGSADHTFISGNAMTPQDVAGYSEVATQGRGNGIHYSREEVRQAHGLAQTEGIRMTDGVRMIHTAVTTPTAGGATVTAQQAGDAIRYAHNNNFRRDTMDNPNVLHTIGSMVDSGDARLADPGFQVAAAHGATMLADYTPDNISHLAALATAGGVRVGVIGRTEYNQLSAAYAPGSDLSTVTRNTIMNVGGLAAYAPDATTAPADYQQYMHTASVLGSHRDFGPLTGQQFSGAVNVASGWAVEMASGGGTADGHLQGMDQGTRRVIVAVGARSTALGHTLSGGDLVQYVNAVSEVGQALGLRDYGAAIDIVDNAAVTTVGGSTTFQPTRVPIIIRAEQALSGASRDARQDPQIVTVLTDLAAVPANAPRMDVLATAAVAGRTIFSGADYNAANVTQLANYMSSGNWGDHGMSRVEYDVIDRVIAPTGLAPQRQLVERIVQFQAATGAATLGTQQVLTLLALDPGRVDANIVDGVSGLVRDYAAAATGVTATTTDVGEIRMMAGQIQSMQRDTVSALVSIQQSLPSGATAPTGTHLINVVEAVNSIGGSSASQEMVRTVLGMNPSQLTGPDVGAILSRAAEISTPANFADNVSLMHFMTAEAGFIPRQIGLPHIQMYNQVAEMIDAGAPNTIGNHNKALIERLVDAGIDPTAGQDYVVVAARPDMARLRGPELRDACTGVINYFEGTPTYPGRGHSLVGTPRWDMLNSLAPSTVRSCTAIQRLHGVDQCSDIAFVDQWAP